MIDRIIVTNFKSFRKIDVPLGRSNLIIGENGSGKSNFLEVFRVLRGLSWGLTVTEVLEGVSPSENFSGWAGIRGAGAGACFAHEESTGEVEIEARGTSEPPLSEKWEYLVKFSPRTGSLLRERLTLASAVLYDSASNSAECHPSVDADPPDDDLVIRDIDVGSILAQVRRDLAGVRLGSMFQSTPSERRACIDATKGASLIAGRANGVAETLASILPWNPSPVVLRQYSRPSPAPRIGDNGENFAALVQSLCRSPGYKDSFLWWLQQLLSDQVEDVGTTRRPTGESIFNLSIQHKDFPATVLSDGTLRFAALLATLLQPEKPSLISLDAVDTAVHANRIRLLYLLLWEESKYHNIQVVATTHSPVMLEWMQEDDLDTTFVCRMDCSTGESRIIPLPAVPHFSDSFKRGARTSDMLSDSWFEAEL